MIELALLILLPFTNGTDDNDDVDWISDDNSTISGCDYYGGGNLRLDCLEEKDCPIIDGDYRNYDVLERAWCH
jgi:hypothetical protein